MIYPKDLTGIQFGHLTVISFSGLDRHKIPIWTCLCNCGKYHDVRRVGLISHQTSSCGCHSKDHVLTHGMKGTPTYTCWQQMKHRCLNPNNKHWKSYGGRGIKVCDRWLKFENFLEDMGVRPSGLSLDRKNNELGYFKDNCQWILLTEQQCNKRNTKFVEYNGERICIGKLARLKNFNCSALRERIERGWPPEKWFNPVKVLMPKNLVKLGNLKPGETVMVSGSIKRATSVWYHFRKRNGGKFSARTIAPNLCEIKRES